MLIDESPIDLPKAIKNPTEVRGMKSANVSEYCPSVSFPLVKVNTHFLGKSNANLLEQVQSYVHHLISLGCTVTMETFYAKKITTVICLQSGNIHQKVLDSLEQKWRNPLNTVL